jgi:hypothetical protein
MCWTWENSSSKKHGFKMSAGMRSIGMPGWVAIRGRLHHHVFFQLAELHAAPFEPRQIIAAQLGNAR